MTTNNTPHILPPLPQQVVSERLIIRPSQRSDAPHLQRWWNDPAVMGPGGNVDGMEYDESDMEDWFQRHIDCRSCATHFVICLRTPQEQPIGEFYIACDDRPMSVDFALVIGESNLWGRGYGREAVSAYADEVFKTKTCDIMQINVRCDNERAIRMFQSIGFETEYIWANGQFQTMTLTQEAFEKSRTPAQTH
ncbi:MAG TPA: GNAT family N-acetyltransferase [Aggregatilineaceae bacterium]|nr:GNAT family N-acetyltransferase [Aggregatilineaceae bacterium]